MSDITAPLFIELTDRYRIEREIGSGGMATVYLARDLKHDRDVAVKVLRPELAAMLGMNRFLNEIRISARLDHPHILTLIDSGSTSGFLYYVMPFVRGESLRDKLKREGQLGLDEALEVARQITSALDYAHRQGVVHRDIKPENILLHEGEAVLADFGIAMAVKEAGGNRLTESGMSLGTPQYMSPEQATGDRAPDARSDIYSMGAVAYEMLAGEPPHTGASLQAVIAKLLTERPTRLRVLRDTVPEHVEAAIAKALEKVPADRYATAGEFARALTTPGTTRRRSAPSRRWIPIVIGGGIAVVAASTAASILARRPAAATLPDRVQLTVTGNATATSLSPDGTRIAFAERQCDSAGACTYQLVIQDRDGGDRRELTKNIGYIYKTQWTRDGRFLAFAGSYPPSREGTFAVSTLSGETRFLCRCAFDLGAGDTAFVHVGSWLGADRAWMRRLTVHDGQTIDSIPIRDSRADYYVVGLTIPDRLIVAVGKPSDTVPPELRLTDFGGRVISRVTPPFGSFGRNYRARWVPSRERLLVSSQREPGGTEFDLLTMKVTKSAIEPKVDTLFTGWQLGDGFFDVSPNAEQLVYHAAPEETSLSTIEVDHRQRRLAPAHITSSTTLVRGEISPGGDRLLLARAVPESDAHASQFLMMPRTGGAGFPIPGSVGNLLDFEWSSDGARIMYLHAIGGNKIRLMEKDTTEREPREIRRLERSVGTRFHALPDGSICILSVSRRAISIIRPPSDKGDTTLYVPLPEWMSIIGSISHLPDTKSLVVEGMNGSSDSVVVATVDIETGKFTRIAVFAGVYPQEVAGLDDGSTVAIFREREGAWAMYRIPPGRLPEKLGTLPHSRAEFSVSNDGRHVAMFSYSDKSDVYMLRNFGSVMRR